jgi:3-deoxy-manno-octulosonate cytidylyltransferase (CMP-KDO synthetase)
VIDVLKTAIIIPARLDSSRFPNKMLCDVGGQTLIRRVYEQCLQTGFDVFVATDSKDIANEVDNVIITGECENGTARIAEAYKQMPSYYDNIINVQGDMVIVPVEDVLKLPTLLAKYSVATLKHPMTADQRNDPNTVKVISSGDEAHWFCRAPLRYGDWHYGIYAYRSAALLSYSGLEVYPAETFESLEQLRWIQNGYTIGIAEAGFAAEINTPEDLETFKQSIIALL